MIKKNDIFFITQQTISLLTNNYIYKDIEEQVLGCQYLFAMSKITRKNDFWNLGLELLSDTLKSAYSQIQIKKNKNIDLLIALSIYINSISKAEKFTLDIGEIYDTINKRIFISNNQNGRPLTSLYLISLGNISSSAVQRKMYMDSFIKDLSTFSSKNKAPIEILIFAISSFYYKRLEKNSGSKSFFVDQIEEITEQYLLNQNIDEKILLLTSLWLLDIFNKGMRSIVDLKTEAINITERGDFEKSINAYLIYYIHFSLQNEKVTRNGLCNSDDYFTDFKSGITYLLKNNLYQFDKDFIISNIVAINIINNFNYFGKEN